MQIFCSCHYYIKISAVLCSSYAYNLHDWELMAFHASKSYSVYKLYDRYVVTSAVVEINTSWQYLETIERLRLLAAPRLGAAGRDRNASGSSEKGVSCPLGEKFCNILARICLLILNALSLLY